MFHLVIFFNEAIPFLDKQLNEFIENIKNVTHEEKKAMLDNANKFIVVAKMHQKMVLTPMQWYKISPQSTN